MAIDAVTAALVELLKASLGNEAGLPSSTFNIGFGAPNGAAANADLVLFLYLITPSPELRNAERVRAFPSQADAPRLLEPAVPLDLHYLLTTGTAAASSPQGLSRLADGIRAIEAASPLVVPEAFQAAVWLSLLPMTTDELSRIWGLFPNENCRSSIAFRASPVWIDPREPAVVGPPVIDHQADAGRMMEPA
jgi:hypothetical protein